jgi:hypothetical protein
MIYRMIDDSFKDDNLEQLSFIHFQLSSIAILHLQN